MLRFIDKYIKLFRGGMDFNTSHVTVYRFFSWHISPLKNYFNTSHVTVYHHAGVGSWFRSQISIHPMLRFIFPALHCIIIARRISIHPMLRFISYRWNFVCFCGVISIHPMLRFIGCLTAKSAPWSNNFNTSHVTVYRYASYGIYSFLDISIHPMLRFIFHLSVI